MPSNTADRPLVSGVILAGGQATRMNGEAKGDLEIQGQRLLDRVVDRAGGQVDGLVLSCNDPLAYPQCELPRLPDSLPGYLGPLAGILAAMEWLQQYHPRCEWLASFAVDTPFFPEDLVMRLMAGAVESGKDSEIICPLSADGWRQPTFCLWHRRQAAELRHALLEENCYKVGAWLKRRQTAEHPFDRKTDNPNAFFNINRPEDLQIARNLASQL